MYSSVHRLTKGLRRLVLFSVFAPSTEVIFRGAPHDWNLRFQERARPTTRAGDQRSLGEMTGIRGPISSSGYLAGLLPCRASSIQRRLKTGRDAYSGSCPQGFVPALRDHQRSARFQSCHPHKPRTHGLGLPGIPGDGDANARTSRLVTAASDRLHNALTAG